MVIPLTDSTSTVYLVQKFPAAKYLAFNLILCGVATAASAAARNYQTLLVARTFLGCFEGTIPPSLILLSSQWYTKPEQALRFSFWYLGLGAGQILGGCVSFGFQHVSSSAALPPWRIMFVATGMLSVAMGFVIFLFVPDAPMEAGWMSHGEKVALLRHVSVNQTGVANRKFRGKELLEAFRDPQIWLLLLAVILVCLLPLDRVSGREGANMVSSQSAQAGGVAVAYSATLIRNLGFSDPKMAALINMPCGAVAIIATLVVGYGIRRQSHRWAWIIACIIPA